MYLPWDYSSSTAEETVQTIQESIKRSKEAVDQVPEKLEEKADEPVKEEVKEDRLTRTVAPKTEESSAPVVTENASPASYLWEKKACLS